MALWSKVLAFFAGEAAGVAAGDVAKPAFEPTRQNAWARRPYGILDPGTAAKVHTQAIPSDVDLADDAIRNGIGGAHFDLLVEAARRYPGTAEALLLWRRQIIDQPDFTKALRRAGVPDDWIGYLSNLKLDLLDPGELSAAIHRGLVPDPGLLKGEQPEPPFNVEAYPVYDIDALDEAAGNGYDRKRLGVLVGLQGLPMGVIEAAQAYFRGTITYGDYIRAFNESNNRNEWAKAVLEYARQIPTARDYIENALRGYRSLEKAQEGAARHGMSAEDALLIFQNSGRPLNLHQITQALAWGGTYNPAAADDPNPWRQAVLLGAVRPEYYNLQEHLKYNLPSAFFFRVLQQQGVLTEAEAVTWYERLGWPPDLAAKVATAFAKGAGASADPHVTKAQNQLWTATHRNYLTGELADADASAALTSVGVAAASIPDVLRLWAHEANIARKKLTPAQIKKAFNKAAKNETTGLPWTRDEAVFALQEFGYPPLQANDYLNIP